MFQHSFMYRPIRPSFGWVKKRLWTGRNVGRQVKKGAKKSSKTIEIISYALEVYINGVICVFVAHFRSSGTFESLETGLAVNIHVFTKTCVTGNNFILRKALCTNVKRKGDVQETGKYQDSTLLSHTKKPLERALGGGVGRRVEQEQG